MDHLKAQTKSLLYLSSLIQYSMRKWFFCFIVIYIFVGSSTCFSQNKDIEWLRQINLARNKKMDPFFKGISNSITPIIIAAPLSVLGVGLIKKDSTLTRNGLVMMGAFCLNSALTLGLKYGVNRPRPFITYPEIEKLSGAGSYSFPSGHASSAFAAATSLSLAFPKWYVITPSFIWAGAVGYSRMHLGVHYPSDVAAGAMIGTGSAILCHWLNKKLKWERKRNWFY